MMIDFALAAERNEGKNSRDSIFEACMLRFRADFNDHDGRAAGRSAAGARHRTGSELRRPWGITISAELIVSQVLDFIHDARRVSLL